MKLCSFLIASAVLEVLTGHQRALHTQQQSFVVCWRFSGDAVESCVCSHKYHT